MDVTLTVHTHCAYRNSAWMLIRINTHYRTTEIEQCTDVDLELSARIADPFQ